MPGAGVEHERRRLAVVRDGDARGVAAVAGELRPGGGGRPPHPEEVDLHQAVAGPPAGGPRPTSASTAWSSRRPTGPATVHGVTARRVAVRRPPSSTARSPSRAPGPSSASVSPSTSTPSTPSSSRKSSSASLALLGEAAARLDLADLGLLAAHDHLRGQRAARARSRPRSRAPASPRRPTGCLPNALRYHSLKSVRPVLADQRAVVA